MAVVMSEKEEKASSNFKDWSSDEVVAWCTEVGLPKKVADALKANNIVGRHLPHFLDKIGNLQMVMAERCGLIELSEQLDFKIAVESLLQSEKQFIRPLQPHQTRPTGKGKLKLPDIKALDSTAKSIYLSVRTKIRKAAEEEFPGNKIPTFRSNPDAKRRLEDLVKRLSETCTVKQLDFDEEGIRSHVMAVLNERRRMVNLGHSYEGKRKSTGSDSENETPNSDGTDILSSFTQPISCTLHFQLDKFSRKKGKNSAVFVCSKKSRLIVSDGTGSTLLVDTHSHPEMGSGTTFVFGKACQVASYLSKTNRDAFATLTEVNIVLVIN